MFIQPKTCWNIRKNYYSNGNQFQRKTCKGSSEIFLFMQITNFLTDLCYILAVLNILETTIQDVSFLLVNIYAPNTTTKQSLLFQTLSELICDEGYKDSDYKIILGGDLNVTMDPNLDCSGPPAELHC